MDKIHKYNQKGSSLVEVILAISLFGLIITALVGSFIYGEQSAAFAGQRSKAVMLAEEGLEAIRSITESAWNEARFNQSAISQSGTEWVFSGEGTTENIDEFTRTINFEDVCRDEANNIADCPASYTDLHTKKIVIEVSWQPSPMLVRSVQEFAYITNWDSKTWTQTNWAGGAGQAIWSNITRYFSDDGNIDYSTIGEIKLKSSGEGSLIYDWVPSGGSKLEDENDSDFNQGSFNNTEVSGTGDAGKVILERISQWSEHSSNGIVNQVINGISAVDENNIWAAAAGGEILRYNGTDWQEQTDVGSIVLYDIDMLSTSLGWATGSSSKFYRYNGSSWSEFSDLGSNTILALDMVNSSLGWATGSSSKFYRYNGTSWSEFSDLGSNDINTIYMLSSSSGWAAGAAGKVYRYNGSSWSEFADLGSQAWLSINMLSENNGWMTSSGGDVYHFNGSSWTSSSSLSGSLDDVVMVSASDGWIAGASGYIYRYNGSMWQEFTDTGNQSWKSLCFTSASNGWIMGKSGEIYEYSNSYKTSGTFESRVFDSTKTDSNWDIVYWTEQLTTGSDITISARSGNTATPDGSWSAWTSELSDAAKSSLESPDSRYFQYRATFTRGSNPQETPALDYIGIIYNQPTTETFNDTAFVSIDDVWAVGDGGVVVHYDGSNWALNTVLTVPNKLTSIDNVAANDIWAVGDGGEIYHYNGTSWTLSIDVGTELNGIHMVNSLNGWIVGADGEIYHYDGSNWSLYVDTGNDSFNDIYMLSDANGWAVTAAGSIYHYNGGAWDLSFSSGGQTFNTVNMYNDSDGWAAGNNGKIFHFNGTAWSEHSDTGDQQWFSVFALSSDNVWAVGDGGEFYHYNGSSFNQYLQTGPDQWNSVNFGTELEGWAVGANGQIRHYLFGGTSYLENGYFISSAFNMNEASAVQIIDWDEKVPVCNPECEIKIQIRSAPDNGGTPGSWSDWYGETGVNTYFTNYLGTIIPVELNGNQWMQYQVELVGDGENTPALQEVRINYK